MHVHTGVVNVEIVYIIGIYVKCIHQTVDFKATEIILLTMQRQQVIKKIHVVEHLIVVSMPL